jgi:hypothetical protein
MQATTAIKFGASGLIVVDYADARYDAPYRCILHCHNPNTCYSLAAKSILAALDQRLTLWPLLSRIEYVLCTASMCRHPAWSVLTLMLQHQVGQLLKATQPRPKVHMYASTEVVLTTTMSVLADTPNGNPNATIGMCASTSDVCTSSSY